MWAPFVICGFSLVVLFLTLRNGVWEYIKDKQLERKIKKCKHELLKSISKNEILLILLRQDLDYIFSCVAVADTLKRTEFSATVNVDVFDAVILFFEEHPTGWAPKRHPEYSSVLRFKKMQCDALKSKKENLLKLVK